MALATVAAAAVGCTKHLKHHAYYEKETRNKIKNKDPCKLDNVIHTQALSGLC